MHFLLGKNSRSPAPLCNVHLPFHFSPAPHASPPPEQGHHCELFFLSSLPTNNTKASLFLFFHPRASCPPLAQRGCAHCQAPLCPGTRGPPGPASPARPCPLRVERLLMKLSPLIPPKGPSPSWYMIFCHTSEKQRTVQWCEKVFSSPKSFPDTVTQVPWLGWVT